MLQTQDGNPAQRPITLRYFHCDHLGTPFAVSDASGKVVWSATFDPWGRLLDEFNPEGIDQPIRFQGQFFDPESGLHYNRHRFYDPNIGSYINQDPIGLMGGINTYGYVANPNGWIDPLGLAKSGVPQNLPGNKNITIRIDQPHSGQVGQQAHAHVYEKGKEISVVNKDGTQSHGSAKNTGKPTNKIKDFLRSKGFNLGICNYFMIFDVVKETAKHGCQQGNILDCQIYRSMGGEIIDNREA